MNVSRIKRIENRLPKLGEIVKLNLGCGTSKREGFIGLDIIDYGQEIVWDMEFGIPLPDNSCSNIFCSHTMEHLEDMIFVMNECHRILKSDGELQIVVPHKDHERALVPPHVRLFDRSSWEYFQNSNYAEAYQSKTWKIIEMVINSRKDMHIKMRLKK